MLRKIRKFSKCGLDFVLHVMKGNENPNTYSDSSKKVGKTATNVLQHATRHDR